MHNMFQNYYPDEELDEEELLRQIVRDFGIFEGSAKILEDNRDHREWLAEERSKYNGFSGDDTKNTLKSVKNAACRC